MIERAILGFIILLILAIVWFSVNHNLADDDGGERRLFEISTYMQYTATSSFLREEIGNGLKHLLEIVHKHGGNDDRRSGSHGGGRGGGARDEGSSNHEGTKGDDKKEEVLYFVVPIVFMVLGVVGYRSCRGSRRANDRQRSLSEDSDPVVTADHVVVTPHAHVPSTLLSMAAMNYVDLDDIAHTDRRNKRNIYEDNDAGLRHTVNDNDDNDSSSENSSVSSSRQMGLSSLITSTPRATRVLPLAMATTTAEGVPVLAVSAIPVDNDAV